MARCLRVDPKPSESPLRCQSSQVLLTFPQPFRTNKNKRYRRRQESSSLKQASEALTADKAKLEEERDELVSKQEHGENVLQKQCKEVCLRAVFSSTLMGVKTGGFPHRSHCERNIFQEEGNQTNAGRGEREARGRRISCRRSFRG